MSLPHTKRTLSGYLQWPVNVVPMRTTKAFEEVET
jgi:hypothetical protein